VIKLPDLKILDESEFNLEERVGAEKGRLG
jgi:hypothetical protein